MRKKRTKWVCSMAAAALLTAAVTTGIVINADAQNTIRYEYSGEEKSDAGYGQGTITLSAKDAGTYDLYWANDTEVISGYYPIASLKVGAGESQSVNLEEHVAIPAGATKIVAVSNASTTKVSEASAVYEIPREKQLCDQAGNLLYTFSSYSDIHIDTEGYYTKSKERFKKALEYSALMDVDFIISSGDGVTNQGGTHYQSEWEEYEKIASQSEYANAIWEANGNHDMRDETVGKLNGNDSAQYNGNTGFMKATGMNNTKAHINANQPYYFVVEENTGDVFIFMALENGYRPAQTDNFSKKQIKWVKNILDTYYGTGVNVYLIEHSPINGYGPGDAWKTPDSKGYVGGYYSGHMFVNGMKKSDGSTASGMDQNTEFKKILESYPDLIWMSGHTHQDFGIEGGCNYSNEQGTSCNMIHNPSVAGTTYLNEKGGIEYDSTSSANDGVGLHSQGYYVEVYENEVVYYGANLEEQKRYPAYAYIMEGSRAAKPISPFSGCSILLPEYENLVPDRQMIGEGSDLSSALSTAKSMLDTCYQVSSYDPYQKLKKLYKNYNNNSVVQQEAAVKELKKAADALYAVAKQQGIQGL